MMMSVFEMISINKKGEKSSDSYIFILLNEWVVQLYFLDDQVDHSDVDKDAI